MNQRILRLLLTSIGVSGIVLSIYLLLITSDNSTRCDFNALFSCSSVLSSSYSKLMDIPVAAFGLIWFIGASILSVLSFKVSIKRIFFLSWSIVSLLGIFYFVYAEYLIGAICLLCTTAHLLGLSFLGLSFFYRES